jgi:hypothetical protein
VRHHLNLGAVLALTGFFLLVQGSLAPVSAKEVGAQAVAASNAVVELSGNPATRK